MVIGSISKMRDQSNLKSVLFRLLTIGLVLVVTLTPVSAQFLEWDYGNPWLNGCDTRAQAMVTPIASINYAESCEVFATCVAEGNTPTYCQFRVFDRLLFACDETADCETKALSYAAIILALDSHEDEVLYGFLPEQKIEALLLAIAKGEH
ncbi:MAG: hypothetical protein SF123_16465 [Chloroflexota bacterium]|nr:hypothetical protein [Chloroflexota bacterium]